MDAPADATPSLSYPQLFSFQVSYSSPLDHRNSILPEGTKKGGWRRGILEVDFPMETFFIQDRDRIFLSQAFSAFQKHVDGDNSDDCTISLKFDADRWEIAVQNVAEKACIQHLLESILQATPLDEVVLSGKARGIIGLDKSIIKHGQLQRKAVNQKRLDERYLILIPGKLFVFKNFDIVGKHVRYVTSLLGATVRMLSEEQEFQILVTGSKTMSLVPANQGDLHSWVDALGASIDCTKQIAKGPGLSTDMANRNHKSRNSKEQRVQWHAGDVSQEAYLSSNGSDDAAEPSNYKNSLATQEPRSDLPVHDMPDKGKNLDANDPPQDASHLKPSNSAPASPRKEQKGMQQGLNGSSRDLKKQSRAMLCLENALDELEAIIGNIKATRRPASLRQFTFDFYTRPRTDISPLRSYRSFDWRRGDEPSCRGRDLMERSRPGRTADLWNDSRKIGRTVQSDLRTSLDSIPLMEERLRQQKNKELDKNRMEFEPRRLREQGMSSVRNSREGLPVLGTDKTARISQRFSDSILDPISSLEQLPKRRNSSPEVRTSYPITRTVKPSIFPQPSTSTPRGPAAERLSKRFSTKPTEVQPSPSSPPEPAVERPSKHFSTKPLEAEHTNGRFSDQYIPNVSTARASTRPSQWIKPDHLKPAVMDTELHGMSSSSEEDDDEEEDEETAAYGEDQKRSSNRYDTNSSSVQETLPAGVPRQSRKSMLPVSRQSSQASKVESLPQTDAMELSPDAFEAASQPATWNSMHESNALYIPQMEASEEPRPISNRQSVMANRKSAINNRQSTLSSEPYARAQDDHDHEETRPSSNRQSVIGSRKSTMSRQSTSPSEPYTGTQVDYGVSAAHSLPEHPSPRGSTEDNQFSLTQYSDNRRQSQAPHLLSTRNSSQQHNLSRQSQFITTDPADAPRGSSAMRQMDPENSSTRTSQTSSIAANRRQSEYQDEYQDFERSDVPSSQSSRKSSSQSSAETPYIEPAPEGFAGSFGPVRKSEFKEQQDEQVVYSARSSSVRKSTANGLTAVQESTYEQSIKAPPPAPSRRQTLAAKPEMQVSYESRISRQSSFRPASEFAEKTAAPPNPYRPSRASDSAPAQYGSERNSAYRIDTSHETRGPTSFYGRQSETVPPPMYGRPSESQPLRITESSGSSESSLGPTSADKGLTLQASDMPELVSRLSKINAGSNDRDDQGYDMEEEEGAPFPSLPMQDVNAYGDDSTSQHSSSQLSSRRTSLTSGPSINYSSQDFDGQISPKTADREQRKSSAGSLINHGAEAINARVSFGRSSQDEQFRLSSRKSSQGQDRGLETSASINARRN